MAISGLIGAGAQAGLLEQLQMQLAQQAQADRIRLAEEENARRDQALSEQQRQFDANLLQRQTEQQQDMDSDAADRRQRMNLVGLEQMNADRDMMDRGAQRQQIEGLLGTLPEGVRTLVNLKGLGINGVTPEMLQSPEQAAALRQADEDADVRRAGRIADAQASAAARHREPRAVAQQDSTNAYSDERNARTLGAVDALMGKVSRWTTGMGSMLSGIPETDARNFAAELDTLKANIAFNELAQMRAASKTGGALGAVSDKEMRLLESSLAALDTGQDPAQFRTQLARIKDSLTRWESARGGNAPSAAPMQPSASHGSGLAVGTERVIKGRPAVWDGKGWVAK